MDHVSVNAAVALSGEEAFILQLRPPAPPGSDPSALADRVDQFTKLYLTGAAPEDARFARLAPLTWAIAARRSEAGEVERVRADLCETLFGSDDAERAHLARQPSEPDEDNLASHPTAAGRAAFDDDSTFDIDAAILDIDDSDVFEVDSWRLSEPSAAAVGTGEAQRGLGGFNRDAAGIDDAAGSDDAAASGDMGGDGLEGAAPSGEADLDESETVGLEAGDADAGALETGEPDTGAPDTDGPEADTPEADASETGAPDTGEPEPVDLETRSAEADVLHALAELERAFSGPAGPSDAGAPDGAPQGPGDAGDPPGDDPFGGPDFDARRFEADLDAFEAAFGEDRASRDFEDDPFSVEAATDAIEAADDTDDTAAWDVAEPRGGERDDFESLTEAPAPRGGDLASELAAFRHEMRAIAGGIPGAGGDAAAGDALASFRDEVDAIAGSLGQRVDGAAQRIEAAADRIASASGAELTGRFDGAAERAERSAALMEASVQEAVRALKTVLDAAQAPRRDAVAGE